MDPSHSSLHRVAPAEEPVADQAADILAAAYKLLAGLDSAGIDYQRKSPVVAAAAAAAAGDHHSSSKPAAAAHLQSAEVGDLPVVEVEVLAVAVKEDPPLAEAEDLSAEGADSGALAGRSSQEREARYSLQ